MEEIKNNILLKIKKIENIILNTKINNHNNHKFYILDKNINSILENDIEIIKNISEKKDITIFIICLKKSLKIFLFMLILIHYLR